MVVSSPEKYEAAVEPLVGARRALAARQDTRTRRHSFVHIKGNLWSCQLCFTFRRVTPYATRIGLFRGVKDSLLSLIKQASEVYPRHSLHVAFKEGHLSWSGEVEHPLVRFVPANVLIQVKLNLLS